MDINKSLVIERPDWKEKLKFKSDGCLTENKNFLKKPLNRRKIFVRQVGTPKRKSKTSSFSFILPFEKLLPEITLDRCSNNHMILLQKEKLNEKLKEAEKLNSGIKQFETTSYRRENNSHKSKNDKLEDFEVPSNVQSVSNLTINSLTSNKTSSVNVYEHNSSLESFSDDELTFRNKCKAEVEAVRTIYDHSNANTVKKSNMGLRKSQQEDLKSSNSNKYGNENLKFGDNPKTTDDVKINNRSVRSSNVSENASKHSRNQASIDSQKIPSKACNRHQTVLREIETTVEQSTRLLKQSSEDVRSEKTSRNVSVSSRDREDVLQSADRHETSPGSKTFTERSEHILRYDNVTKSEESITTGPFSDVNEKRKASIATDKIFNNGSEKKSWERSRSKDSNKKCSKESSKQQSNLYNQSRLLEAKRDESSRSRSRDKDNIGSPEVSYRNLDTPKNFAIVQQMVTNGTSSSGRRKKSSILKICQRNNNSPSPPRSGKSANTVSSRKTASSNYTRGRPFNTTDDQYTNYSRPNAEYNSESLKPSDERAEESIDPYPPPNRPNDYYYDSPQSEDAYRGSQRSNGRNSSRDYECAYYDDYERSSRQLRSRSGSRRQSSYYEDEPYEYEDEMFCSLSTSDRPSTCRRFMPIDPYDLKILAQLLSPRPATLQPPPLEIVRIVQWCETSPQPTRPKFNKLFKILAPATFFFTALFYIHNVKSIGYKYTGCYLGVIGVKEKKVQGVEGCASACLDEISSLISLKVWWSGIPDSPVTEVVPNFVVSLFELNRKHSNIAISISKKFEEEYTDHYSRIRCVNNDDRIKPSMSFELPEVLTETLCAATCIEKNRPYVVRSYFEFPEWTSVLRHCHGSDKVVASGGCTNKCDPGWSGKLCNIRDCSVSNGDCLTGLKCQESETPTGRVHECLCPAGQAKTKNGECEDVATDGNLVFKYYHTQRELNDKAWYLIDLQNFYYVDKVHVYNHFLECCKWNQFSERRLIESWSK
ncbi:hypothetical protein HELRODRAFT_164824 [Helobdella robusta]|uniref:Uncharacterized protein n=1 Tax=Helobdella robusta TaxID=6412 RepID=T1EVU8_HELRO|nr:hypothetical protein HELRODRAFT_164824 [Helobdella robusta]ESN92727.1 hypothetical protein HELRODRAFT_164824 [Helobdella robusta]